MAVLKPAVGDRGEELLAPVARILKDVAMALAVEYVAETVQVVAVAEAN